MWNSYLQEWNSRHPIPAPTRASLLPYVLGIGGQVSPKLVEQRAPSIYPSTEENIKLAKTFRIRNVKKKKKKLATTRGMLNEAAAAKF